jgi:hypothetical protein
MVFEKVDLLVAELAEVRILMTHREERRSGSDCGSHSDIATTETSDAERLGGLKLEVLIGRIVPLFYLHNSKQLRTLVREKMRNLKLRWELRIPRYESKVIDLPEEIWEFQRFW